ncbi:uncharacterized protein LOC109533955 isoform X1 [Dendroctonus ponderosae]|uniref:Structure-specific endonuclease subunit SLX4 n=3 Tax=Dendroctonus ponderosae TaxID=77166 RepID=A0AAR5P393_DENPD|nr:uncharacterized protein LOC109533955 isoform X1 [Dendroctonus ponderosae]XP_048523463.1 uncharacterized protein LOC109533955 isoform X1 [Dendroctonus ponderosae]
MNNITRKSKITSTFLHSNSTTPEISPYFLERPAQANQDNIETASKPTKKVEPTVNLNDSTDDFMPPVEIKKRKFRLKKPQVQLKSKKRRKSTAGNGINNYTIEIFNENVSYSGENGDHLQLAVALSNSSYEAEYGQSSNSSALINEPLDDIGQILKNSKPTNLERFGFQSCKASLLVSNRKKTLTEVSKKNKNRFKYITPVLNIRSADDRESFISSKISLILNQLNPRRKMQWDPGTLCSKLRKFMPKDRNIFQLAASNEVDNFYIDDLNLPKSEYKCGCLLKDWSLIPGRDKSPTRDLKENNDSCIECLEAANSQQLNTFEQSMDEHSKDPPAPSSPDLFPSDDDACLGTSREATEYKSFISGDVLEEKHFSQRLSSQYKKTTVDRNIVISEGSTSIEVIELSDDDSENNEYVRKLASPELATTNLEKQNVIENQADIKIPVDRRSTEISPSENDGSGPHSISFEDNTNSSGDELSGNWLSDEDGCSRQATSLMVDITDIIDPMCSESSDDSASNKEIENIFEGKELSVPYATDDDEPLSHSKAEEEDCQKSCFENYGCFQITNENPNSEQLPSYENIDTSVGVDSSKAQFCRSLLGYNSLDLNVTEYVKSLLNKENECSNHQGLESNSSADNLSRFSTLDESRTSDGEEFTEDQPVSSADGLRTKRSITPTNFIIKTRNVTPMPHYDTLTNSEVQNRLKQFGIKTLTRTKGIKLLKYIYESTHPLVETVDVREENATEMESPGIKRRKKTHTDNPGTSDFPCEEEPNLIEIVGDSLLENERLDDLIFERTKSVTVKSCQVPLQIVWHNFLCCNPTMREQILLYRPLILNTIHQMLKSLGFKFNKQDLLTFLDRKCISVRCNTIQKKEPCL